MVERRGESGRPRTAVDSNLRDTEVLPKGEEARSIYLQGQPLFDNVRWEDAMAAWEALRNPELKSELRANPAYDKGVACYKLRRFADAPGLYKAALAIFRQTGDPRSEAQIYNNFGRLHTGRGEWQRAVDDIQQSLRIKEELGEEPGKAYTCNDLGLLYSRRAEWEKAGKWCEAALSIRRKLHDAGVMVLTLTAPGETCRRRGMWQEALPIYQEIL